MKRAFYLSGVFCLCLLIMFTLKSNLSKNNTSSRIVPAAQFLSRIQAENENLEKIAYLTFDDGPSEVTPMVLDALKEKDVKATFFLVGNEMKPEREETVKRIIKEGHAVGVHTETHKRNDIYGSFSNFFKDFEAARKRIKDVTGKDVKLHRYPWGSANGILAPMFRKVTAELQSRDIRSFDWNATGNDSFNDGVCGEEIKNNIARDFKKYVDPIILLHDSNETKNTALILGDIIDMIKKEGYKFDTLENRESYLFPEEWRR